MKSVALLLWYVPWVLTALLIYGQTGAPTGSEIGFVVLLAAALLLSYILWLLVPGIRRFLYMVVGIRDSSR